MTRDVQQVRAELQTMCQLQEDTRRQLRRTRNTVALKQQEIGVLELHEYQLVCTIDARARKMDRLLDELSQLHRAEEAAVLDG